MFCVGIGVEWLKGIGNRLAALATLIVCINFLLEFMGFGSGILDSSFGFLTWSEINIKIKTALLY